MQGFTGALQTALLDTTMAGKHNSTACLAAGACDPLGGHSVWAALPPFAAGATESDLPLVLVLAQMDGSGLFHEEIVVSWAFGIYLKLKLALSVYAYMCLIAK